VTATLIERSSRTCVRSNSVSRSSLNYCDQCGRLSQESLQACVECGGEHFQRVSQAGTIYSYTNVRQSDGSFVLALVELTDGPLVMGRVVGVNRELRIGLPVQYMNLAEDGVESASRGVSFEPQGAHDVCL
jgi:uncharacterized OB-fold protein